ncbi:hypothetical protein FDE94_09305 [Clostridium botulinum]|nr:hypothetical protein [Clostridium botulinum]
MFKRIIKLFKKEKQPIHEHKFEISNPIGKYYKLYRTEYRNCFDKVVIYIRVKCECGHYADFPLSKDSFLPSLHYSDFEEKQFIENIKKQGIEAEYEINLRTKTVSNRVDRYI